MGDTETLWPDRAALGRTCANDSEKKLCPQNPFVMTLPRVFLLAATIAGAVGLLLGAFGVKPATVTQVYAVERRVGSVEMRVEKVEDKLEAKFQKLYDQQDRHHDELMRRLDDPRTP